MCIARFLFVGVCWIVHGVTKFLFTKGSGDASSAGSGYESGGGGVGGCSQQEQPAPPAPIAPSGGSGLRKRASSSFIKSCRLVGRQESGRGAKQISDSNHSKSGSSSSSKKQLRAAHCKSSGYESCSNGERDSLDSKEASATASSPSQVST